MISCVKKKNEETNLITIYCALYMEAQYLIQYYELKKASVSRHFQVFANEEKRVRLVITGAGRTNAAVAVAEISMIYPPASGDIMINYGSCAAENMFMVTDGKNDSGVFVTLGSTIMVNKLTDVESGRTFYPDMIYRHPFLEGEVETSVHVYTADAEACDESMQKTDVAGNICERMNGDDAYKALKCDKAVQKEQSLERVTVHDMEAAAFYEAGNFFYGPHQMMFLKAVTDHGMPANATMRKTLQNAEPDMSPTGDTDNSRRATIDRAQFVQIMQTAGAAVAEFLDGVLAMMQQEEVRKETGRSENSEKGTATIGAETFRVNGRKMQMQGDIQEHADHLAEDMHCSVTMRAELMQLLTYWCLAGFDAGKVIDGYYEQEILPCKDKRAGRRLLDELQNKWL